MEVTKENAEKFFLRMAFSFSDCKDGKSIQAKVEEMRKPLSKEECEILDDYFDKNRRKCWNILLGGIGLSFEGQRLFSNSQAEKKLDKALDKTKDFSEIMQAIEDSRADFISMQERFLEYAMTSEIKSVEDLDGFYGLVRDYSEKLLKQTIMTTKIQSLPMAVVFKLVKADLMESYRTHDVQVLSIGLCDPDEFDDDDNEQSIMVTATVNSEEECFAKACGTHPWLLTWDEEECSFFQSMRWDQDEDGKELSENVVERCDYVGITMDGDWADCKVDLDAKLKVPVKRLRWNYPFEVKEGSYNVYPLDIEAETWGDLLDSITEVFKKEYAEHESEMSHALGDYIIELLEIHPNNLATVQFGS